MEVHSAPTDDATMEGRKERTIWNELESDWVRWLKRPFRSKDETTSAMRIMTPASAKNSIRKKGIRRK